MEFHEKLQKLRKDKGLTQEDLAEALYVSRTAISKWESGRGYPSIDSLKELSNYFKVSIDELLSADTLITIAKKENKDNIAHICHFLFGICDMFSVILILLPLYPKTVGNYIYSVNLIYYSELNSLCYILYWMMFLSLIILGFVKTVNKNYKIYKSITVSSIFLHILLIILLAITGETYAIVVSFLLLIMKTMLVIKSMK